VNRQEPALAIMWGHSDRSPTGFPSGAGGLPGGERELMRLWHLVFAILVVALVLTIARDPAGRVAVIVFITGLGEVVLATTALLALFQTIGAIGEARSRIDHAQALLATTLVLTVATSIMAGLLFAGAWLVMVTVV
jgi:hypothetical protein